MHRSFVVVITCEHASNKIPKKYRSYFRPQLTVSGPWGRKRIKDLLDDHWGWDPGAFRVATFLHQELSLPLFSFPVSRLLIEGNRFRAKNLFSPMTDQLSDEEKVDLWKTYWLPHVKRIHEYFQKMVREKKTIVHITSHSFTPNRNGIERHCDVGVLFDPRRPKEKVIAHQLQKTLQKQLPHLRIRRNYPYTGISEGLTLYWRKAFPASSYIGIDIEVNQKHLRPLTPIGRQIQKALAGALREIR